MPYGRQVGMNVECKRSRHHGFHPLFEDCPYCGDLEEEPTQPMARIPMSRGEMFYRWLNQYSSAPKWSELTDETRSHWETEERKAHPGPGRIPAWEV